MISILEQPRTLTLAGKPEVLANYSELASRIEGFITLLQDRETALVPGNDRGWADLEIVAKLLNDLVEAACAWLADEEAARETSEQTTRQAIRDLNF